MRIGKVGRVLVGIFGVLVAVPAVAVGYALVRYDRVRSVPMPDVHAVTDPAVVARGRYLVYGPGRCADCHTPDAARPQLFKGEEVPLTGGPGEHTYIGTWSAPNLTPDPATGIGRVSDGEFARMLRYGVNRRGRIAPPFMDSYANLADDDLVAILSYLRSIPPEPGTPPDARVNLLGKITLAYFLDPYAPDGTPPAHLAPDASAAYGGYIANTLGGCRTCHTARNLETGAYTSPPFSGGLPFHSRLHPGQVYVSPNLTPDPATGHLTAWPEDGFVARFRAGLLIPDSPMPWGSFRRMSDRDLRAVYRYLHSLAPVHHDVGPVMQAEHGQAAG
jgi:mono/diheme cytochrome c family protein